MFDEIEEPNPSRKAHTAFVVIFAASLGVIGVDFGVMFVLSITLGRLPSWIEISGMWVGGIAFAATLFGLAGICLGGVIRIVSSLVRATRGS